MQVICFIERITVTKWKTLLRLTLYLSALLLSLSIRGNIPVEQSPNPTHYLSQITTLFTEFDHIPSRKTFETLNDIKMDDNHYLDTQNVPPLIQGSPGIDFQAEFLRVQRNVPVQSAPPRVSGDLEVERKLSAVQRPLIAEQKTPADERLFLPTDVQLHSGDLIFRQADTPLGHLVYALQTDALYSHVGIIHISDGKQFVIHVMPLNPDGSNVVRYEPLEIFIKRSSRIGKYRLNDRSETLSQEASEVAYNFYLRQVTFDQAFDLESDHKLYCTELVWKSFRQVGIDIMENNLQSTSEKLIEHNIIFPTNMSLSPALHHVLSVALQVDKHP